MIQIENLEYQVSEKVIIENLSMHVDSLETIGLIGNSGSGKSTLLKLIAGHIKQSAGKLQVLGVTPENLDRKNQEVITIWQDRVLYPNMSVKNNITIGLKWRKVENAQLDKQLDEVVEMLNIRHLMKRGISNLSGGEQQKIALARAIILKPKLLLLDEPFNGLDNYYKETLKEDLAQVFKQFDITALIVSHNLKDIKDICNRICLLKSGSITEDGTFESLRNEPKSRLSASLFETPNQLEAKVVKQENARSYKLSTDIGKITTFSDSPLKEGEEVLYVIKSDALKPLKNNVNKLVGTICGIQLEGKYFVLTLNSEIGTTFEIRTRTIENFEINGEYEFSWGENDGYLIVD